MAEDHQKIKQVDVKTMEAALARTFHELTGAFYKCDIAGITYGDGRINEGVEITMTLHEDTFADDSGS
ncbi:MAG TPA: hypothetical protein VF064_07845 [Pyrinomonadaceae bacterium]